MQCMHIDKPLRIRQHVSVVGACGFAVLQVVPPGFHLIPPPVPSARAFVGQAVAGAVLIT
jgi:hypothetical protein